ncbi:NADP-dependent oxidoreductase [Micromonospora sp. LOL_023]|uniref:NADP-dependent oxidoreductase n=1 Tax=Micromonospora sp. LOL_023 TaxID=3345418 RepID=UPI003A89FACC
MSTKIVFYEYGEPDVLRLVEFSEPEAAAGQVRVQIRAAGVNPVDCKIRRGAFSGLGGEPDIFPQTLGNEFAGVVDQVGEDVVGVSVGDEVFGFANAEAYGKHLLVTPEQFTAKPAELSWETAGSLSAVGQTAWNALRELQVCAGDTLLVHAAAGGVGTVAVQLAVASGVHVIGTASQRNHDYLRSLGAYPVEYGDGLTDRVRELAPSGVDATLDAIGGAAIAASLELVSDRERIGTLVDQDAANRFGIKRLRGTRSSAILAELAAQCAAGNLKLPISKAFSLKDAADAHREVETGHVRGKVTLVVD